jgi:hypothetical protein
VKADARAKAAPHAFFIKDGGRTLKNPVNKV